MKISKDKILKASAEFSLIVFGILLALRLDNWNDDRKVLQFANETLAEIKSSLESDLIHLKSRIKRLKSISKSLENVSQFIEGEVVEKEELSEHFSSLASYIVLELNTSSYETLKVTGINVIKNSDLRFKLVDLYDYSYPKVNWMLEKEFNRPNENDYWPIFNRYVSYLEKSKDGMFYISKVNNPKELLEAPKLVNAVRQKINKSQSMIQRFERLEKNIAELIKLLATELK